MIKVIFLAITLNATVAESSKLLVRRSTGHKETPEAIHSGDETSNAANVFCTVTMEYAYFGKRDFVTCLVTDSIEHEDYYLNFDINPAIELFNMSKNENVKYLPRDIGVKLPNLIQFKTEYAGLTIIRDFNLKNMRNVRFLGLYHNEINTIEPKAFDDLVKVERMHLDYNELETLNENLFASMVALENINLNYNKIKTLKPSTFEIPNGKLDYVEMVANVCVGEIFTSFYGWTNLQSKIGINCSE